MNRTHAYWWHGAIVTFLLHGTLCGCSSLWQIEGGGIETYERAFRDSASKRPTSFLISRLRDTYVSPSSYYGLTGSRPLHVDTREGDFFMLLGILKERRSPEVFQTLSEIIFQEGTPDARLALTYALGDYYADGLDVPSVLVNAYNVDGDAAVRNAILTLCLTRASKQQLRQLLDIEEQTTPEETTGDAQTRRIERIKSALNREGNPDPKGKQTVKGKVKWFSDSKGYGIIALENGGELFVHYSGIAMDGFKTLCDGEWIEFEIARGPKGDYATNVARTFASQN